MKHLLPDRLLRRELGEVSRYSNYRGLYGDRCWVNDLDIVNELGGHSGCVNALSWSSSGRLLASGSDDQHLNIHSYQPDSSTAPFALTTTVATGHTQNIFSVKFMPHSNDATLVTAAGDAEVRVFDIEYSGRPAESSVRSHIASSVRGQRFENMYKGVRYLSDGNTNARVYRSHVDRVKRIVTESSPNLFLTCSEDGEVRQFDLRLPSSAYPRPKGGTGFLAYSGLYHDEALPAPLISYKRFQLDLNTISCSASQPHYIALGGTHLHCFLHDRRMLGRDTGAERGEISRASPASSMSSYEEEGMTRATRCVRKFAPDGRKEMRKTDNGHITACKISDANPNEMIVSWSGDHIYSFDLVKAPDASTEGARNGEADISRTLKSRTRERKRKRTTEISNDHSKDDTRSSNSRRVSDVGSDIALRVRYQNGQTEDIAMSDASGDVPVYQRNSRGGSVSAEAEKGAEFLASKTCAIHKSLFSWIKSDNDKDNSEPLNTLLRQAAMCIPRMDEISRSWKYPVDPLREDVLMQKMLRSHRDSIRRFVHGAGTLAHVLHATLENPVARWAPLQVFLDIGPGPHQGPEKFTSTREMFLYDFLKAIMLWLQGGEIRMIQGFTRPSNEGKNNPRFPISQDPPISAIDTVLIPYLLRFATNSPIPHLDVSRFERDETRMIFKSETDAVVAFSHAIKMPLIDEFPFAMPEGLQSRQAALKFWGLKVSRALLMLASKEIKYQFIRRAFGGSGYTADEEEPSQEDIDVNESDGMASLASLIGTSLPTIRRVNDAGAAEPEESPHDEIHARVNASNEEIREDNENDDNLEYYDDNDDGYDHDTETHRELGTGVLFESTSDSGLVRENVEAHAPSFAHTRKYSGHCNVKTVKDANFFGLNDEYVVSGSDSGHLFIWDKKTTELVNILEGDNEVVNVVQGHPYEPLLAVSGIDHTIKIFSPDHRAQYNAANGIDISSTTNGSSGHSSLSHRRRRQDRDEESQPPAEQQGLSSRKRIHQQYQITSQNDVQRQGGMRDAFITRGMLAQLAARLRARQAAAGGDGDGDGGGGGPVGGIVVGNDGETVMIDDNCTVM